jgi:hypothetical protein
MRKAVILILSLLVLGGIVTYGVHIHNRDAAIFAARKDFSVALAKASDAHFTAYNRAVLEARTAHDEADAAYDVTIRNAQVAHDEAVAKVAALAENDSVRVEAVRKADVKLQMDTLFANMEHHIAKDKIEARLQDALDQSTADKERALADAKANYDAATKSIK